MDIFAVAFLLAVGFGLGLTHAVEADHLAAVSTIVSDRKNPWSAAFVGGLWGVGHTVSLFLAGLAVILFRINISERTAQFLEFCVGLMLIGLGIDAFRKLIRGRQVHSHSHSHGAIVHAHPHIHDKASSHASAESNSAVTHHGLNLGPRPLIVGMIHGLAGSGALMLLVLATIPSVPAALAYILIFGIGSIGGMMLMSLLIGVPLQSIAKRSLRGEMIIRGAAGLFSLGFGLFMVYEISSARVLF